MKTVTILVFCFSMCGAFAQDNDALIKACGAGDLASVKKNIDGGANVNFKNAAGATPISSAFMWPEVTEYLLSKGADANGGDYPALVNASMYYSVDVMKLLLKGGADPNKAAEIKVDLTAGVRKLLDEEKAKGKKANKYMVKAYEDQLKAMPAGNTMTFTALGNALSNTNCEECVELLLNAGAKTDFKSAVTGGNAVHEVAFNWQPAEARNIRNKAIIDYYEKASLPVPEWYKNLDAANLGSAYGILKLLKAKGADFEYLDNNKRTPLTSAVLQPTPNEELIMALVDNGANMKATGKNNDPTEDAFKQNGIELLTPHEFLDTQEKAELYYGFVQESAKKEHTTITRVKSRTTTSETPYFVTTTTTTTVASAGTLKVCPSGMGYREFFVANEQEDESMIANFQGGVFTANRKLTSNLGYELCKGLGVDAVVVVYIATRKPKQLQDDYGVNAVVTMMLGPNPSKNADTDPEAKNRGQFYCGTRTYYSSPAIYKEAKGIFGQYDGMANVLQAHAIKMSKYIQGKEKDE